VTSVAEPTKSSDLKLIVYVCYTEEIVDMVVPDVILLYPMHENSKYALDPFMVEWCGLPSVVGFESPGLKTVENGIGRDGQEDQAFGIHVDSFVAEEGRESTSLL
jgi:hypothetical protein